MSLVLAKLRGAMASLFSEEITAYGRTTHIRTGPKELQLVHFKPKLKFVPVLSQSGLKKKPKKKVFFVF
jgi:hypothetical protein